MSQPSPSNESSQLNQLLRRLPPVEALLGAPQLAGALQTYRRDVVLRQIRDELAEKRARLKQGGEVLGPDGPSEDFLLAETAMAVLARLEALEHSVLRPVINASGVLIHTNLGRALLSERARAALLSVASAYSNLELDLASGQRTRRDVTLEPLLLALSGAPAATVVNNNAAAVLLILHALAGYGAPDPQRREVIGSRGEMVEIGGSYRVPDMLRSSGCELVEVGTTNRTRIADYENAITERTALLLKTHPSNYRIRGFTEEVPLEQLVALGRRHKIPVYFDLGSGYLAPENTVGAGLVSAQWGGHDCPPDPDTGGNARATEGGGTQDPPLQERLPEPDILSAVESGADIVSFSSDKLLGGPQAGIVLATQPVVKRLRKDALWRCLRIDKFTASALAATLAEQLRLPARRSSGGLDEQLRQGTEELRRRADSLCAALAGACPAWRFAVVESAGGYGGGSLPEELIDSFAVTVEAPGLSAAALDQALRTGDPAIAGGFVRGYYALNVLALLPGDMERLAHRLAELAAG